jgi:hypothetical protein
LAQVSPYFSGSTTILPGGTLTLNPITPGSSSASNPIYLQYSTGASPNNYLNTSIYADASGNLVLAPATGLSVKTIGSSTVDASAGFKYSGTAGFSGTKTAGSCTLTIQGGIITNVSGC